jgi:hypothetical protein
MRGPEARPSPLGKVAGRKPWRKRLFTYVFAFGNGRASSTADAVPLPLKGTVFPSFALRAPSPDGRRSAAGGTGDSFAKEPFPLL